jgi:hypothetical protein
MGETGSGGYTGTGIIQKKKGSGFKVQRSKVERLRSQGVRFIK